MSEIRLFSCCMCPARYSDFKRDVCPDCDFLLTFVDERGWKYSVWAGLGDPAQYKPFYIKPGKCNGHGCHIFEWRDTFWAAQEDLNKEAAKRGWTVIERRQSSCH